MSANIVFSDKIITLKSVYDKANIKYMILPCRDKYGKFANCVKRVDSHGDMVLSEKEKSLYAENKIALFPENQYFEIYHGKTYNLENMWEAAEWEAIKNCPLIAKDRFEKDEKGNLVIDGPAYTSPSKPLRYGIAELYIDRPGVEVQRRVSRKQLVHKAESFILNDENGVEGQLNMARLLGKNMSNQPIADITDFLLRIAEKNPEKIISLYTGTDTSLRLLFIEAKEKKVIRIKNKLYLYGDDIVLGATDDAVIAWMQDPKNKRTLDLIKKEVLEDYQSTDE